MRKHISKIWKAMLCMFLAIGVLNLNPRIVFAEADQGKISTVVNGTTVTAKGIDKDLPEGTQLQVKKTENQAKAKEQVLGYNPSVVYAEAYEIKLLDANGNPLVFEEGNKGAAITFENVVDNANDEFFVYKLSEKVSETETLRSTIVQDVKKVDKNLTFETNNFEDIYVVASNAPQYANITVQHKGVDLSDESDGTNYVSIHDDTTVTNKYQVGAVINTKDLALSTEEVNPYIYNGSEEVVLNKNNVVELEYGLAVNTLPEYPHEAIVGGKGTQSEPYLLDYTKADYIYGADEVSTGSSGYNVTYPTTAPNGKAWEKGTLIASTACARNDGTGKYDHIASFVFYNLPQKVATGGIWGGERLVYYEVEDPFYGIPEYSATGKANILATVGDSDKDIHNVSGTKIATRQYDKAGENEGKYYYEYIYHYGSNDKGVSQGVDDLTWADLKINYASYIDHEYGGVTYTFDKVTKNNNYSEEGLKDQTLVKASTSKKNPTQVHVWFKPVHSNTVNFRKIDKETKQGLQGAEFALYRSNLNGNPIKVEITSDSNGEFKVSNLESGVYYLKETKAPAGYDPLTDNEVIMIDIKKDGTVAVRWDPSAGGNGNSLDIDEKGNWLIPNKSTVVPTSSLTIEKEVDKVDPSKGDAVFTFRIDELNSANEVVSTMYKTIKFSNTGNQKIEIHGLPVGTTYKVTELDTLRYKCVGDKVQTVTIGQSNAPLEYENNLINNEYFSDTDVLVNIVNEDGTGFIKTALKEIIDKFKK